MQAKIGHGFLNSDKDWRVKQQLTYFFILIHTVSTVHTYQQYQGVKQINLINGLFCTTIFNVKNQKEISSPANPIIFLGLIL